jgi:putative lipoprotein
VRRNYYGWTAAFFCLLALAAAAQDGQNDMVSDLAGTKWRAEHIGAMPVSSEIQSSLEFGEANQVSGKAGCNRFTGVLRHDGKTLAFGPLASTRMMCAPPVMDQEEAFLKALGAVRSYTLPADGKLLLFDEAGLPILRFTQL